jgi:hypothetical protein
MCRMEWGEVAFVGGTGVDGCGVGCWFLIPVGRLMCLVNGYTVKLANAVERIDGVIDECAHI